MPIWPFNSKPDKPAPPKLQDQALSELSQMFLKDSRITTPGNELIDISRFDFSIESLVAMDEHLEVMRTRDLQGKDQKLFVLRAGAYVGEVIRRHSPPGKTWHWVDYEQAIALEPKLSQFGKDIGTVAILWDCGKGFIFPLAKVGKYLQNGPEDSVKFFAQVILAGAR
jgi:hypothetical protein